MKEDKKATMPRNDCIDFNIYPDKSQTNLRAVYDKEEPLFLYPHRDSNLDPMPINRHCEAFAILIKKSAGIARFQRFTSDPGEVCHYIFISVIIKHLHLTIFGQFPIFTPSEFLDFLRFQNRSK